MAKKKEVECFLSRQGHISHTKEDVYEILSVLSSYESVKNGRPIDASGIIGRGRYEVIRALIRSMDCGDIQMRFEGGHAEAERGKMIFCSKEDDEPLECGLRVLEVEIVGRAGHRDVLGAILSLGVKRSMVGDIGVLGSTAYAYVSEDMAGYIEQNLIRIGKAGVKSIRNKCCDDVSIPEKELKTVEIVAASMRIDLIASKIFKISRREAKNDIEKGKVKLNDFILSTQNYCMREKDVISYRGCGKFMVDSVGGTTKKGNNIVKIKKYV